MIQSMCRMYNCFCHYKKMLAQRKSDPRVEIICEYCFLLTGQVLPTDLIFPIMSGVYTRRPKSKKMMKCSCGKVLNKQRLCQRCNNICIKCGGRNSSSTLLVWYSLENYDTKGYIHLKLCSNQIESIKKNNKPELLLDDQLTIYNITFGKIELSMGNMDYYPLVSITSKDNTLYSIDSPSKYNINDLENIVGDPNNIFNITLSSVVYTFSNKLRYHTCVDCYNKIKSGRGHWWW